MCLGHQPDEKVVLPDIDISIDGTRESEVVLRTKGQFHTKSILKRVPSQPPASLLREPDLHSQFCLLHQAKQKNLQENHKKHKAITWL